MSYRDYVLAYDVIFFPVLSSLFYKLINHSERERERERGGGGRGGGGGWGGGGGRRAAD